jgi:predicted small lipoprotein YifL
MKSILFTLVALLLVGVLAGCGQSGPLYVPGEPSSLPAPTDTSASDEDSEDENEENKDDGGQ